MDRILPNLSYHSAMNLPSHIAIIGPTASGKTSLALELAQENSGVILSLDSLAVYREIDIASAKPTREERGEIPHFGIDLLPPDAPFDVTQFFRSYHEAEAFAREHQRPLIIVGGSGFYLKMLIEGVSPMPEISDAIRTHVSRQVIDLSSAHRQLELLDPVFAKKIEATDAYRIEKGLIVHYATGMTPSAYFESHPPKPILSASLPIYEVVTERSLLRERIALRTAKMLRDGLIDEVCRLERRYTRAPNCMKAIGITEVLSYLDGPYDYAMMKEKIITHTARLAKRQVTFNKSQFTKTARGSLPQLKSTLLGGR